MSVSCVGVSVLCVRVCTPSVAAKEACLVEALALSRLISHGIKMDALE